MRALLASFALGLLAALPLQAECRGQDLIAALPQADLQALEAAAHAVPFPQGNLWQARRDGAEVTLVGTYHLDDRRHEATMALLAPELAQARRLLVEAGPAEEEALKAHLAAHPERLVSAGGPTLPEALAEEDWQRLSDALRARDIPPFMAARLQPWYVMSLLSIPACQFAEAATAQGLDKRLVEAAQEAGLPVAGLEPFDTIFAVFDSLTAEEQLAMLRQTAEAEARGDDMAVTLADSYFAGENRLFWEFSKLDAIRNSGLTPAAAEEDFARLEEVLLTSRNKAWITPIEAAAAEGPALVAVGALHLAGETGLLNLLANRGWTITPLTP